MFHSSKTNFRAGTYHSNFRFKGKKNIFTCDFYVRLIRGKNNRIEQHLVGMKKHIRMPKKVISEVQHAIKNHLKKMRKNKRET